MSCAVLDGFRSGRPSRGSASAHAPGRHACTWSIGSLLLVATCLAFGRAEAAVFVALGWAAGVAVYEAALLVAQVERLHRRLLERESMRRRPGR
ncbi:MAG: hypothetical protein GX644_07240 [Limnobacter sp.]|nr:hypothetical protein [Limnobacter sp.]